MWFLWLWDNKSWIILFYVDMLVIKERYWGLEWRQLSFKRMEARKFWMWLHDKGKGSGLGTWGKGIYLPNFSTARAHANNGIPLLKFHWLWNSSKGPSRSSCSPRPHSAAWEGTAFSLHHKLFSKLFMKEKKIVKFYENCLELRLNVSK